MILTKPDEYHCVWKLFSKSRPIFIWKHGCIFFFIKLKNLWIVKFCKYAIVIEEIEQCIEKYLFQPKDFLLFRLKDRLSVIFKKIGKYFFPFLKTKRNQPITNHAIYLNRQLNLILASVFNDDILIKVKYHFVVHRIVLNDL